VRIQPEREVITQLLCIPGHDFTRATAKRQVRIVRTNMTTLTQICMTLLLSNILPSDRNVDLPLRKYQLVCAVPTYVGMHYFQLISNVIYYLQGSRQQDTQWTQRSPARPWGFQLWLRASISPKGCPYPPTRSRHHDIGKYAHRSIDF